MKLGIVVRVSAGSLLAAALGAQSPAQVTQRVSISWLGEQGNNGGGSSSLSGDGRFVAFASHSIALVTGDGNGRADIFVRDRQSGTTERVSVSSLGAQGHDDSILPSISADGRCVAFASLATLVSGDTNGARDIFVRDRLSGTTERVSVDSLGAQASGGSSYPSISADGRYVAFKSDASNLVDGDTNIAPDIFVHDRLSGTTERVSVSSLGDQGNTFGGSESPSISGDGRYVVFQSGDTNLVSGDTNIAPDIFVRDRLSGTTERVSVDSSGAQADRGSYRASISADGRCVAFMSDAHNLVGGDTNDTADIFVKDLQSGKVERVSVDSLGAQANRFSSVPSLSADARYVAFQSMGTNLVGGDTNGLSDVFVHDRLSAITERVSVDSLGAQGNSGSSTVSISGDGRCVAFDSSASNLVGGDTNLTADVFVRGPCLSASSATFPGDGINADTVAPVNALLGSTWSAPVTLGHPHGTGGLLALKIGRATVNGRELVSPMGGRPMEVLIAGQLLGTIVGSHDGTFGDVPPQTIPDELSLTGLSWAAQYTVVGGGFGDLSQAVSGVIGCP